MSDKNIFSNALFSHAKNGFVACLFIISRTRKGEVNFIGAVFYYRAIFCLDLNRPGLNTPGIDKQAYLFFHCT